MQSNKSLIAVIKSMVMKATNGADRIGRSVHVDTAVGRSIVTRTPR